MSAWRPQDNSEFRIPNTEFFPWGLFMNLYDIAIRRPVFTVMLMLALVVFGILGYQALPINLLPSIEFPMVTVITILPGASPEVMESDVTDVIEAAVNTIEGIKQLTS